MLLPLFLFSLNVHVSLCHCKDGAYCNEILNVRFTFASRSTKCNLWTYALAPDLFAEKRLITSSYCPVSCSHPCGTSTGEATTISAPAQRLNDIMKTDYNFRDLIRRFDSLPPEDALERYDLYSKKKTAVDDHNRNYAAGNVSYAMALNGFSVLKKEEIAPNVLLLPPSSLSRRSLRRLKKRSADPVDWRPWMQNVTDQKKCGGCWAFAMVAVLEGTLTLRGGTPLSRSVQQLLDCDRTMNPVYNLANQGCAGGYLSVATDYLSKKPLEAASLYPFTEISSSTCRQNVAGPALLGSFSADYTATDDPDILEEMNEEMEERVRHGPVAVGFANSEQVYAYGSGVFDGPCGSTINHAVTIVGFTEDYWIVRNSWGQNWGEDGHIRIKRVTGKDPCKLVQYWATAAPISKLPSYNNALIPVAEESTTQAEENATEDSCEVGDCESCGCEEDDEEWTEDGTAFAWPQ